MKSRVFNVCISVFCTILLLHPAASGQNQPSAFELFASDSVAVCRIVTDIKELVKNKMQEEYQPAVLQIAKAPGDTLSLDIEIKSRGNIRKEVCYYPPIMLRFKKKKYDHRKLKMVNPCRNSDIADEYVLKEYLAYKMFEVLTDKCFRVHLVRMEYVDTGRKNKSFTRYAFILEHEDAMAERVGGRIYEPRLLKEEMLEPRQLALFTMFQFMIANTDWALVNMHNLKILAHEESGTLLPIAYDFDYSGFIYTDYATPHQTVPIEEVNERFNKGYCIESELCEEMRLYFMSKKADIIGTCEKMSYLNDKQRRYAISFIEDAFKIFERPKATENTFSIHCQVME